MEKSFKLLAEVPIEKHETAQNVLAKAKLLFEMGFDMLVFPDRSRSDGNIASIFDLIRLNVFPSISADKSIVVFATRSKTLAEIGSASNYLKTQGVKNVLLVTGDPHKPSRTNFLTSVDVIPSMSKEFSVGGVIHPDMATQARDDSKITSGASFMMVQATYNPPVWSQWLAAARERKINEKAKIYQVVIPLVNKNILDSLRGVVDIDMPEALYDKLSTSSSDELLNYGITNAVSLINQIKNDPFFSGAYIYTKDFSVLKEILSQINNA